MREKNKNKLHLIPCVLIPNLFQRKSMKVNYNLKNTLNKEFEHAEELRAM
jgi:hypothetical protein